MTDIQLQELEVANFRSVKGVVHAPLDAKVVLIHGENGSGKTSLLAAIEFALTGVVTSLRRADPNYTEQLLYRSADQGRIELRTLGLPENNHFNTLLTRTGIEQREKLPPGLASIFSERCYLPQSLLGQLLQIYQDSDSSQNSPLSRFVDELLGLDRLDAIETGLFPVGDIRNLRKTTELYGQVEYEKSRLDRTLAEHRRKRDEVLSAIAQAMAQLSAALSLLGLSDQVDETKLNSVDGWIAGQPEEEQLSTLADQRRQIVAIEREVDRSAVAGSRTEEPSLAAAYRKASSDLRAWQQKFENAFSLLSERINKLEPEVILPRTDPQALYRDALVLLRARKQRVRDRALRAAQDAKRALDVAAELVVVGKNLATIDAEIGRIAANSGNLAAALAEISSFITNDLCPVCDRDFAEEGKGRLAPHVNRKIRALSGSAERLLGLSKNRADQQILIERLEREAVELGSRQLDPKSLAGLEREAADIDALVSELDQRADTAIEGSRLAAAETAARRALTERQSQNLARTAAMATLTDLSARIGHSPPEGLATPQAVIAQLLAAVDERATAVNERLSARRSAAAALSRVRDEIAQRQALDTLIEADAAASRRVEAALNRASAVRYDAQQIKAQVEVVRSRIIGREFNDRLNRLWRDLFVRLAPQEPFVPEFKIPSESTRGLQPKLITAHRLGGVGGTPGAMLSTGNLNTAAVTLFIALHLTVSPKLPWLLLDDPVQSMDDVHIAHFAALLRTLSKEHNRQVIMAVHDRQLFEYLRLELSPAFVGDSLLSLELTRHPNRDTLCVSERRSFQEETALRFAA
jgi:DNA repair exonuclease SbcCD ATPase subunit